ncbi:MAG TPA: hypothetical protein VLD86_15960 [Ilumatobacteraceae bacterium]|nr:hypothetical protein [Ilumatobacteraceae bacterium]
MNGVLLPDSWWLLLRARGVAVALRILVLTSPLVAVGCTWIAAGHTVPAINVVIVALILVCAVLPDSHIGLLVVVLVGIEWLATVHDETSPWAVGAAASLTVFHASMAAASVTPPAARWTRAMRRRWVRRSVAVMLASSATWAVVAAIHGLDVTSSTVLVTSSLVAAAVAGLWARDGTLDAGRRQ